MDFDFIFSLIIGWLSGWLVNYLADTLPATRRFSRPTCPSCQATYHWGDYLLFRKCPSCNKRRLTRTLIVQGIMVVASLLLWIFPRSWLPYYLALPLLIYLAVVFILDMEHRLILHPVSLFGAVLGLGIGIFLRCQHTTLVNGILNTLLGGTIGFGVMLVFYFAGKWYVQRMSQKRGLSPDEVALGFGDVNLAGIIGLLLGWPAVVAGLLYAIFAGGLVSLIVVIGLLVAKKYKAFTAIPYAPFLILSAIYLLYL